MANTLQESLPLLAELTGKMAMELVYAEAGKDNGLLPANCLLAQIEELAAADASPPEIQAALAFGRRLIDQVFNTTGLFDEAGLKQFGDLLNWLAAAWDALECGQELPPLPALVLPESGAPAAPAQPDAAAADPAEPAHDLPLHLNLEQDAELLQEFVSESQEHLQNIELGVLVLEESPTNAETLSSIFRAFHTFKGGSGLLNLTPINHLAHDLESLLDLARQHQLEIDSTIINLILEGGDRLKQFIAAMQRQMTGQEPRSPIVIPAQDLVRRVRAVIQASSAVPGAPNSEPARTPGMAAPADFGASINQGADDAAAPPGTAGPSKPGAAILANPATVTASMVKVGTQKLDNLMDLVGEMVIAQSLIAQDSGIQSLQSTQLSRNLAQLSRITGELQKTAMAMRMVPIRPTFQKMNRLVRDLAARQGKQVELVLSGEDTELDRTIVEELNDPLVHMIRNSIDHGIEAPDQRQASGKPPQGTIHLRAYHQGGSIVIEIEDNGAGLNRERILAKAMAQGLVTPEESLSESEVFQLIFAAGFSTAAMVTDISGRGVGMDVVQRNVQKLRGKVDIESRLGWGSRFTISLPLTLAIIDGLIVGVGEHRYILPTLLVRESFRPTAAMISTVQGRGEIVSVRGRLSPLLRLHDFFGVTPKTTDPTRALIIVVGSDHHSLCLLVDELVGKQEVVIKSLGETFKHTQGLAGAAILGDGRVGLILDVDAMVRRKAAPLAQAA